MQLSKLLLKVLILVAISTMAQAGKNSVPAKSDVAPIVTPYYIAIGASMGMVSMECDCNKNSRKYDTTNFGAILRFGYDFNPYLGIEGRFIRSQLRKNFATTTYYGIFMKPQYHIVDSLNVYGLIGYGHTKIDCKDKKTKLYNGNNINLGAGFEYDLDSNDGQGNTEHGWGLFVDYQNNLRDAGSKKVRSNIISAGVTYDF